MIMEGTLTTSFSGTAQEVTDKCLELDRTGWRIKGYHEKRQWPYFWRIVYTLDFVKDIICDDKHIIETPINEFK